MPLSHARIPSTTPTMAVVPVASPSIPSVRFAPFESAVITITIMNTYMAHLQYHPHLPLKGESHL